MNENNVLKSLQNSLSELVILFSENKISEEDVLKQLHETIYYTNSFRPFIFESFFIEALKLDKVPKVTTLIVSLFKNYSVLEDNLVREDYNEGTRCEVLRKLKLDKSLKNYNHLMVCLEPESHSWFGTKYQHLHREAIESDMNWDCFIEELFKELSDGVENT